MGEGEAVMTMVLYLFIGVLCFVVVAFQIYIMIEAESLLERIVLLN